MNQNWIVENLNNAFSTWNGKLTELWGLVTTSPQTFKGGAVWGVMQSLHNALIGMRVMANCYMDSSAATWVYFDEIHVLLKDSMSADFLDSTWKRFRKYNAYATGITQDIQDYLANPIANALLSNSEFVIMLRQTKSLDALKSLYGLSNPQLEFLRNASEGHGIIKMGNSMIPFSRLYLILSSHTFQLFIAQHSLVQFLLHLVEEIGTAFVFPTFDVGIEAVAILRLNTEYLVENRGELF